MHNINWKAISLIVLGHIAGSAGSAYGTKSGNQRYPL